VPDTTHPPAFAAPRFDIPLDIESAVNAVPQTALIKGFFLDSFEKMVVAERPELKGRLYENWPRTGYSALKSYWRGEVLRAEAHLARLMFPELSQREALRRASHRVYPTFLSSLVGRVVLVALFANDVDSVLKVGPRMMSAVVSFGKVEAQRIGDKHWRYHYSDYYSWLDCGDVGVIEGLLRHYHVEPHIEIATNGPFDMHMDIQWR
jgi:uncharacterized protein (TIGR02265 family)